MLRLTWLSLIGFRLVSVSVFGQRTTASLSGTVTDPSGAVVPAAKVIATEVATGAVRRTETDASGYYVLIDLAPGTYSLQVEKSGFHTAVQKGIVLQVDRATDVNMRLTVGSPAQKVTVTAQGSQVNVRSGTQSYEITTQMAEQLPLNGRNVLQLQELAPDVYSANAASSGFSQSATRPEAEEYYASASGAQANTTAFYLDGGLDEDPYTNVANVFPNPDAIQEFSYESNDYSAKFGGSGGGVMNALTRGGTDRLHGTLYDFVRNGPIFDARDFFDPTTDLLKWNQFGGSVGGPIQKDKSFFFFSYQGLRERIGASPEFAGTPTEAERNGDWSAISTQFVNPTTGVPFANNQVSTSLYNPIAMKILALVPAASATTGLAEYLTPFAENDNQYVARVDRNFGENFHLYGTYLFDGLSEPSTEITRNLLTADPNQYWRSQHATLNGTWTLRPNLLANFNATFDRASILYTGAPSFPGWTQLGANIPNLIPGGSKTSLDLGIGGYFGTFWDGLYRVPRQEYDYATNWSWIAGNHTLEYGGEIERDANTLDQDFFGDGDFNFDGALSGNNLLDFMLGKPSSFEQIEPLYESLRRTVPALYLEDTWRATRNLTWSIGVRWDPWTPWTDIIAHQAELFSPTPFAAGTHSTLYPNLPPGLLVAGDPGVPLSGFASDYHVFDPRIGFAYKLFGTGTTSIRGGYGIYHDQVEALVNNRQLTSNPFSIQKIIEFPEGGLSNPYVGTIDPFPAPRPTPHNYVFPEPFLAVAFYPGTAIPTTQQWNLTVEHQLPAATMVRVSYEGSNSYHMFGDIEGDPGIYDPALSFTQNEEDIQQRRSLGKYFTNLELNKSIGTANFNALVVSVEKRATHGLSLLGGYRWSKCMDEVDNYSFAEDDYSSTNPFFDYGPCGYNVTNQFELSYEYQLPRTSAFGLIGRYILSGWENTGILTLRDGTPYSILSGEDRSTSGIGLDRADILGDPHLPSNRSTGQQIAEWFNAQSFTLNTLGTFGDTGRDFLTGPAYSDFDFSVIKSFPISKLGEATHVDFRADFFDLFNYSNFGNPISTVISPGFGSIDSAASERIIQLSLKLYF
jgi:hypothetical protein